MRAMILAAGRGQRMGDLTLTTPKPLLRVFDHYLIEYTFASLKRAGITDIVINVSYLATQLMQALGDGRDFGVNITYSIEETRLETGGGIVQALPLLGDQPFLVISSDIICDFPLQTLASRLSHLAHLVLVDNPSFHPEGDFGLQQEMISMTATPRLTFANIGIYHPDFFKDIAVGHFPLNRLLFKAIENNEVSGEYFQGLWFNVGTQQDLSALHIHSRETLPSI